VDVDELGVLLNSLMGANFEQDHLDAFVQIIDENGDGQVSLAEFLEQLGKVP
jgi:Ca2+-binding EF-hand superfamily protein